MLGNSLIVLTIISYAGLVNVLSKPSPGGDYGVGYSWLWLIVVGGFLISTGLLVWNMHLNHCFDWMPASFLRYRKSVVFMGWIAFVVATIISIGWKSEANAPIFVHWWGLSKGYMWLPLLMLIPAVFLLNAERQADFAPNWVKIPMQIGFSLSMFILLCIFYPFAKAKVVRQIQGVQGQSFSFSDAFAKYNKDIEYINNYNEATIEELLKFVSANGDTQKRKAATAKIKTFDHWENDLIAVLTVKDLERVYVYVDNTCYVYDFLDKNKVEHADKFIQPIIYSLKVLTIRVEKDLNDPFALELGRLNIETVCRVLETQFKDYAKEFKPSMLKLHEVLATDAPERENDQHRKSYNKRLKAYRLAVKNWLDANP